MVPRRAEGGAGVGRAAAAPLLGGLALIVLGLWLWSWTAPDRDHGLPLERADRVQVPVAESLVADSEALLTAADSGAGPRSAIVDSTSDSEQVAPRSSLRVRVIEGRYRQPVAGAEVRLLGVSATPPRSGRALLPHGAHHHRAPLERGLTDAAGEVTFRAGGAGLRVEARAPGRWAAGHSAGAKDGEEFLELSLVPDRSVEVLVVRGRDRVPYPGAEVALTYCTSGRLPGEVCDWQTADAQGLLRFEQVTQYLDSFWPNLEFLAVEPAGSLGLAVGVRLDPDATEQRVELLWPDSVALDVELLDLAGQPHLGPGWVTVRWLDAQTDWETRELHAALDRGRARFEPLAPGLTVTVTAQVELGVAPEALSIELPRETDAVAVARLQLLATGGEGLLRIVGPDGLPLERGEVFVDEQPVAYDRATGVVRLNLFRLGGRQGKSLRLRVGHQDGATGLTGTVRLARFDPGITHDLGTLRLTPARVRAEGRVRDSRGAPLEQVQVQWLNQAMRGLPTDRIVGFTDAEGRFRLSAEIDQQGIALDQRHGLLSLFHPDYVRLEWIRLDSGAEDLEFVLEDAGGLEGSLILDPAWLRDFVRLDLDDPLTGARTVQSFSDFDPFGRFAVRSIPPGTYRCRLSLTSGGDPLVEIEQLVISAGARNRDPRLQEVDLRGRARSLAVTVWTADGRPIEEPDVRWRLPGASQWSEAAHTLGHQALLFTAGPEVGLFVAAAGFRSRLVPQVRGGERIVLEPAQELGFHWATEPPRLPRSYGLEVRCTALSDEGPEIHVPLEVASSEAAVEWVPWGGGDRIEVRITLVRYSRERLGEAFEHPTMTLAVSGTSAREFVPLDVPQDWIDRIVGGQGEQE
jgi:hypothetical protein